MFTNNIEKGYQLNLKNSKTTRKAVKADGITKVKVLGEVSTSFTRGDLMVNFQALVIDNMGVDLIGGTDFSHQ